MSFAEWKKRKQDIEQHRDESALIIHSCGLGIEGNGRLFSVYTFFQTHED